MLRFCFLILVAAAAPAQVLYEIAGRISPEGRASVSLFGATHPFTSSTFTGENGRFTFKKLEAATYTVAVFQPGRGEARQTIEVGPSLADSRNRIQLTITLKDENLDPTSDRRRHAVNARQLTIPDRALRLIDDVPGLVLHAVDVAAEATRLGAPNIARAGVVGVCPSGVGVAMRP